MTSEQGYIFNLSRPPPCSADTLFLWETRTLRWAHMGVQGAGEIYNNGERISNLWSHRNQP